VRPERVNKWPNCMTVGYMLLLLLLMMMMHN
jgi:hypothetical protein